MNDFGKVAVVCGGNSNERQVSLASGKAILDALRAQGIDAHAHDISTPAELRALCFADFDRIFIALHGRGGEDGSLQALLDLLQIPYTGSNMLACALTMDKFLCKQLLRAQQFPVKNDMIIDANDDFASVSKKLNAQQLAIKPVCEGSSVGISRVVCDAEFLPAWQRAGGASEKIMAEAWITGREITCAIINGDALPLIEIKASGAHQFYDYDAKYLDDDTRYICPAKIPSHLAAQIADTAKRAFAALGCSGWGRVDFIVDENDDAWLLEINTVPGMTNHSLVPLAAQTAAISFQQLVIDILKTSL